MKTLTRAEIASMEADMAEFFAPSIRAAKVKATEPFAKRTEGRDRRTARRARIADKHSFLNS